MAQHLGDRAVELTAELVAIDSVNPTLSADGGGEARIAEHLAQRLSDAGFTVHRVAATDPRRPSVVAVRDGSVRGPSVVFNGHLDTVPVEGMPDAFAPRIVGERLFGRGASDMKGGVAGLVVAAEELARRDAPGRQIVALVADEEDGSIGATAVLERLTEIAGRPDVCVVAEPTWLDIAAGHRGFEVVRVDVAGRAAHSSQPGEGRDVIPVIAGILAGVVARDGELQRRPTDPQLERGSLMTTVVRAGSAPFTIAATAEILIERRTLPSEPAEAGLDDVEAIVAAVAVPEGVRITTGSVVRRSPWRAGSDGASAQFSAALEAALVTAGRPAPARRGFPYWMESALWEEAGIPTVVCGPAGGGLHAVDEWVDLEQVRAFPVAVMDAVERFAAGWDAQP